MCIVVELYTLRIYERTIKLDVTHILYFVVVGNSRMDFSVYKTRVHTYRNRTHDVKHVVCRVGGKYNTYDCTRGLENVLGTRWLVICMRRPRGKSSAGGKSEDELNVAETIQVEEKPRELIQQCSKALSLSRHCNGCVKFEFNDKQLYTKQRS